MKLRKNGSKTSRRNKPIPVVSQLAAGNCPITKEDRKAIKPVLLNSGLNEDVTSHVLSFKCLFCDAYIFTLQSFIIHLKSSHPNEDVSGLLSDQFRSCIVSVEKEKIVIVSYAFPRQDVDLYLTVDDGSPNTSSVLCAEESKLYGNLDDKCQNKVDGHETLTLSKSESAKSSALSDVDGTASPEFLGEESSLECRSSVAIKDLGREKIYSNDSKNNDETTKSSDERILEILRSIGAKTPPKAMERLLLAESTRRRQMTTYEKIMALTCQKCGQKFKNRCMLTRHAIEHKRANNPYRCTVDGCLDSYTEKRKLLGHLNYKHSELSKEEREIMLLKGDELLEKLHNASQSGPLVSYSGVFSSNLPVVSSVDTAKRRQIIPTSFPSAPQEETFSVSTAETSSDEGLCVTDSMSPNNILKNMVEYVDATVNNANVHKKIKLEVPDSDEVDSASSTSAVTASRCSFVDVTASVPSTCDSLARLKTDEANSVLLKGNSLKRPVTVRELLGLDATKRHKGNAVRSDSAVDRISITEQVIKSEISECVAKGNSSL